MIEILCVAIVLTVIFSFYITTKNKDCVVGIEIAVEDITEFVYTYSSTTYPPKYRRYRFYQEEEIYKFYHEKREGSDWPLTESHITVSSDIELSEEQWIAFLHYLKGGKVKERKQSVETGGAGPWLYLYWKGDQGKYQEFSFLTLNEKSAFEEFCMELSMFALECVNIEEKFEKA